MEHKRTVVLLLNFKLFFVATIWNIKKNSGTRCSFQVLQQIQQLPPVASLSPPSSLLSAVHLSAVAAALSDAFHGASSLRAKCEGMNINGKYKLPTCGEEWKNSCNWKEPSILTSC